MLLGENVKGLVGHDGGKTLDTIVQTLCDIGYTVDFEVLNSKYFGVPQNRERIFIVAVRDDLIEPESWKDVEGNKVVPKGKRRIQQLDGVKTFNFDWPPQEKVTVRLRDILESEVDEKYYLSEEKTAKLVAQLESKAPNEVRATALQNGNMQGRRIKENDEPSFTVSATDRHGVCISEPQPEMLGLLDMKGQENSRRVDATTGISPTLTTMGGGHREPKIAEEVRPVLTPDRLEKRQNGRRFKDDGEESFTLTAQDRHGIAVGTPPRYRIRKLTPRECFRLQGFPDSEFDKLVAAGISNSKLYKMAGNAVTVNVIDAIGRRLLPYLN